MASKFSLEPIFLLSLSHPPLPLPRTARPVRTCLVRPNPVRPALVVCFGRPRSSLPHPGWPHRDRPSRPQSRSRGPTRPGLCYANPVRAARQVPAFPTSVLFARPHSVRIFRRQSRPPGRLLPRPAPAQSGPAPSTPFLFTLSLQSRSRSATTHSRLAPSISLTYLSSSPHPVRLVVFLLQAPFLPPHPRGFRSGAKSSSAPETGSPALRDLLPSSSSKPSSTPDLSRFQTFFTPSSPSDTNSSFNQSQPASPRQRRSS